MRNEACSSRTSPGLSSPKGGREQVRHFEGAGDAASALRGLSAQERQQVVDELVEAALADGKLTAQETAAVERIAEALDLAG